MKYTATDKNELLKEGTEFEFIESTYVVAHFYDGCRADMGFKNTWIEHGWCKEVQEKEFTKDDMHTCVNEIIVDYVSAIGCTANFNDGIKAKVNNWIDNFKVK